MELTKGGSKVTIYQIGSDVRPRYQVAYYIGRKRKLKNKATLAEAKDFANEQLNFSVAGRRAVAEMTEDDRNTFMAVLGKLQPLEIGLVAAIEEFVAATLIMDGRGSLVMAAKEFIAREQESATKALLPQQSVDDATKSFIEYRHKEWLKDKSLVRDLQTIRSHCRQFSKSFHCPIRDVTKKDIVNWLGNHTVAKKTYNNKRTSIIRMFRHAKLQGYLPDDKLSAAELVPRYKKLPVRDVHALPPATLRTLLDKAIEAENLEVALYFAFASQTGLRTAELQKFLWEHVKIEKGIIDLPRWVTKNRVPRKVPLQPSLVAWIKRLGGVGEEKVFSSEKATDRSIDFARPWMPPKPLTEAPKKGMQTEAEADWWENCMRDSYGSYRTAILKQVGEVALEMGNSEAMIKRCYLDYKADEEDARLWFLMGPPGWKPPKSRKSNKT